MQAYARTDIGCVRKMNQDVYFYTTQPIGPLPNLFIVADGMGGHRAGDFAARYAIDVCVESIKNCSHASPIKALDEAVKLANSMVFEKSETNAEYQGMGTTMVLCFIESGQLYVANVGDSRLYLLGDGFSQVTEDHSYVAAMVRAGEITEEEARFHPDKNMITRAIGVCDTVRIDYFEVDLKSGDRILLCSDGLTNMVSDQEIGEILDQESPQQAVDDLVERAIDYGGADNITAIVVVPGEEEVTG
jgi:protein phosphatase